MVTDQAISKQSYVLSCAVSPMAEPERTPEKPDRYHGWGVQCIVTHVGINLGRLADGFGDGIDEPRTPILDQESLLAAARRSTTVTRDLADLRLLNPSPEAYDRAQAASQALTRHTWAALGAPMLPHVWDAWMALLDTARPDWGDNAATPSEASSDSYNTEDFLLSDPD